MKSNESKIFDEALEYFESKHNLFVDHPYNDEYFELIKDDGTVVCRMNPKGFNLLYNLKTLTEQLAIYFG